MMSESTSIKWYRSVPFAVTISCLNTILLPGSWDALGNLGAGGRADPYLFNTASAITFGIMILTCGLSAILTNVIGFKFVFIAATLGYLPYGVGLYMNSVTKMEWLLLFGAATCGISAGAFWSAEGTVFVTFPTKQTRGFWLMIWAIAKNFGPMLGGIISLGINAKKKEGGSVSPETYIVFFVLMALSFFVAFLMPSPKNMRREDGSKIEVKKPDSVLGEFKLYFDAMTEKRMLLLTPALFFSYFYYAYMSDTLTETFNVRTRAFNSLLSPFGGVIGSYLMSFLLDAQSLKMRTRARIGFIIVIILQIFLWTYLTVLRYVYHTDYPLIDWSDSFYFGRFYPPYFFFFFVAYVQQSLVYWTISSFAKSLNHLTRYASMVRSLESCGQMVSWILQNKSVQVPHDKTVIVNFVGIVVTLLIASPVFLQLSPPNDDSDEETISDSEIEKSKDSLD